MKLQWKKWGPGGLADCEAIKEKEHGHLEAEWGIFEISLTPNWRIYKDGTTLYMVYLSCPSAHSREIITLTKVRGYLPDAIKAAEDKLFSKEYPM